MNNQEEVFFDGETYSPEHDKERLGSQLERVKALMQDGKWRNLREIHARVGGSEAAVSARIRDLRKARFGSHTIEHRRLIGGLWEYRMERK